MAYLEMVGISKHFPGVKSLDGVNLNLERGKIHALVGENGAGKSTLMKILGGVYRPDGGIIKLDGKEVRINDPGTAIHLGISVIPQELQLIPYLSVAENMLLGGDFFSTGRGIFRRVNYKELYKKAGEELQALNVDIDPKDLIVEISPAMKQMVTIVKALSRKASILVFDEPTAALTRQETENLFKVIKGMAAAGKAIVYITHRFDELAELAQHITVLRDGKLVESCEADKLTKDDLIYLMTGRHLESTDLQTDQSRNWDEHEKLLVVQGLTRGKIVNNVSFSLSKGEILGIAGPVGSGRTELVRCIFGADKKDSGTIKLHGKETVIRNPEQAVKAGIALVPEERREQGIFPKLSIKKNITIASLKAIVKWGTIQRKAERSKIKDYIRNLAIKTPHEFQLIGNLSGGNQQKAILARWLDVGSSIYIFDEPTRGIDVGAKEEIHNLIRNLAEQGLGVIVISSDVPELVSLCNRIVVMRSGRIISEIKSKEITEAEIIRRVTGMDISKNYEGGSELCQQMA